MKLIHGKLNSAKIGLNGIIVLHAGDTFSAPIVFDEECFSGDDKLYIGIMEPHQPFKYALVRKVINASDLAEGEEPMFKLESNDTEFIMPGTYYYEIKLQRLPIGGEEIIDTVVPRTKLIILD